MSKIAKKRSHGKIESLPLPLKQEVENRLVAGQTYAQIADYLNSEGHDIHLMSVQRYGKPFLQRFEALRMSKHFSRLLVEDNIDRPATELHEANNALINQMIMSILISEDISAEEKIQTARAIASLQNSQARNEQLKLDAKKIAGNFHTAITIVKQRLFDQITEKHPDLAEAILAVADEVEKELESEYSDVSHEKA